MKMLVVAIDPLKGSLSSLEAGQAIMKVQVVYPEADVVVRPLQMVVKERRSISHRDGEVNLFMWTSLSPLGDAVTAEYTLKADETRPKTAIIEMFAAAGITLVPDESAPMHTTNTGVGELN